MKRVAVAALTTLGVCGGVLVGHALRGKSTADAQATPVVTMPAGVPPGLTIIPPTPSVVPAWALPPQPPPSPPTPVPIVTGPARPIVTATAREDFVPGGEPQFPAPPYRPQRTP